MNQRSNLSAKDIKDIGARFRSVRSLVNINRKTFCERHDINRYTMQSWENGLHVSKGKNIEKFIEALAQEGITCSIEWLIEGTGSPPRAFNNVENETTPKISAQAEQSMNKLLEIYSTPASPALAFLVKDSSMAPKYLSGDLVIGSKIEESLANIHQRDCIVKLAPERMLLRRAFLCEEQILLVALDQSLPTFTLSKQASLFAVVWHLLYFN